MRKIGLIVGGTLLMFAGYVTGSRHATVVHAASVTHGKVPKSYGKLVAAIPDQIGTGLVFEDKDGVIRFVAVTGMKEGELGRY